MKLRSLIPGRSLDDTSRDPLAQLDARRGERRRLRSADFDRQLLELRHRAALQVMEQNGTSPEYPAPATGRLPEGPIPEVRIDALTPELLRAGILSSGCVLVRGLIGADEARSLRDGIDRAFEAREAVRAAGGDAGGGYYAELVPDPRFDLTTDRGMVSDAFNVWGADSPRVMRDLLDTFDSTGLQEVISGYLGERPAVSVNKCTLRRIGAEAFTPDSLSAWHQDGAFLKDVRAMNVWLALSRCGDVAPGLDIVPRRVEHIVETGTEGAAWPWSVSRELAERTAGDRPIQRPIFEPGDALLFDEMLLHATAGSPDMPDTRYAVECWFFGTSGFPEGYVPLLT